MNINHLAIHAENNVNSSSPWYLVKNTQSGKYVRLGEKEVKYLFTCLNIDPKGELSRVNNAEDLPFALQTELEGKFTEWGFLEPDQTHSEKDQRFDDLSRIRLFQFPVDKTVSSAHPILAPLFGRSGIILQIATFLGLIVLFFYNFYVPSPNYPDVSQLNFSLQGWDYIVLGFAFFFSMAIHELAHAVACRKFGGQIKSMGIMLFFLFPVVYCDVSDVYRIADRRKRALVSAAGVMSNLLLSEISMFVAILLVRQGIFNLALFYVGVMNFVLAIYNLIPLVKLDGYWILSAMTGISNLMDKGFIVAYTTLFRRDRLQELQLTPGKRRLLALYGILSFFFKPLFWLNSIYFFVRLLPENSWQRPAVLIVGVTLIVFDLARAIRTNHKLLLEGNYSRQLRLITNN